MARRPPPSSRTQVVLSDVHAVKKRNLFFGRDWNKTDLAYAAFLGGMHLLALAAPFTFSWPMVWLFLGTYFVSGCLGITLSYHRQLSHRSFQTPKWLEYVLAYCGVLAVQVRTGRAAAPRCPRRSLRNRGAGDGPCAAGHR